MKEKLKACPDSDGGLNETGMIDATHPGFNRDGIGHVAMSYAPFEARKGFWSDAYKEKGQIKPICAPTAVESFYMRLADNLRMMRMAAFNLGLVFGTPKALAS